THRDAHAHQRRTRERGHDRPLERHHRRGGASTHRHEMSSVESFRAPLFRAQAAAASRADTDDAWPHTTRALPWLLAGFLVMIWLVPFGAVVLPGMGPPDRPALVFIGGIWFV